MIFNLNNNCVLQTLLLSKNPPFAFLSKTRKFLSDPKPLSGSHIGPVTVGVEFTLKPGPVW